MTAFPRTRAEPASTPPRRPPTRVCACHGAWQLITLAAALETERELDPQARRPRTVLALSGERLSPELRRAMGDLGGRLPGFDDVRWIDDLLEDFPPVSHSELRARLEPIAERLEVVDAAEIWTANPRTPIDRALFERYRSARVVLFEDGLSTYAAPWTEAASPVSRAVETAKASAKALTRRGVDVRGAAFAKGVRLLGQRVRRPAAVYLVLDGVLGTPAPYRGVSRSVAGATLARVVARAGTGTAGPSLPPLGAPRPRALILGASYSFWGAMEREQELALYAQTLERLAARFELWWKEHPRAREPFLPALRRRLHGTPVHPFDGGALPLELLLRPGAFDLLVAGTSTSLFSVPLLFEGVRVATFADAVLAAVGGVRRRIAELVLDAVPTLDAVLAEMRRPPHGDEPPARAETS